MEHSYREMRRRHRVLMNGEQPRWRRLESRRQKSRSLRIERGPGLLPATPRFQPDANTPGVIEFVEAQSAVAARRWRS